MNLGEAVKSFIRNGSVGAKVAVGLFFVLVFVVIIMAIVFSIKPVEEETNIDVSNFEEVTGAPKVYETETQKLVWQIIQDNNYLADYSEYEAVIREGSYEEFIDGDRVNATFIIDIDELKYSFEINLAWTKGLKSYVDPQISIGCPYYTDVIYPETKCIVDAPITQVSRYLPWNDYLDENEEILVHIDKYTIYDEPLLLVYIRACKDQSLLDRAMDYTREWLKSVYLDPNDFKLETYDTC